MVTLEPGALLYEGSGLLAVNKPAGLPSTGRTLDDPNCLQYQLMTRHGGMVWAIHQLDQDTSGVNLFVTKKSLVAPWQRRLRRAKKGYLAICHGLPSFERRRVEAPIGGRRSGGQWRWAVDPDGRRAISILRVLARGEGTCLLEVVIETGRTHQARIHLAYVGHPLVGDRRYGDRPSQSFARHALHASEIALARGLEPARIRAPMPPDLTDLAGRLGLSLAGT